MSSNLKKSGAGYYAAASAYQFPTKGAAFLTKASAQLCYNCHTTNKTSRHEDYWKTRPSRSGCGSCHDGVDFSTGLMRGTKYPTNTDVTHGGGKQLDDSKCAGCHTISDIKTRHNLQ